MSTAPSGPAGRLSRPSATCPTKVMNRASLCTARLRTSGANCPCHRSSCSSRSPWPPSLGLRFESENDFAGGVPTDAPILPKLHSILARDVVRQHGDELPEEPPLPFLRP
jgi:hypothetical protein